MKFLKKTIKSILPKPVLNIILRVQAILARSKYRNLTASEVFTKIYEEGAWGKSDDPSQKFFSGTGSHAESITTVYVEAIRRLCASLPTRPNAVDLGCGDFYIGASVRPLFDAYIACDIVEPLIEFNKDKYRSLNVDFRVLDLTKDDLPCADIVFIRQVLQHLDNGQIEKVIPKIHGNYKYLVLTEHLPESDSFTINLDKPAGPDIRLFINSGIILTKPPFNLRVAEETCLCEVPQYGGRIRTMLYKLA